MPIKSNARTRATTRHSGTKDSIAELDFNEDRSLAPRTGYARIGSVEREQASLYDEGEGGRTVDNTASADDLSPETLFDETGGDRPLFHGDAADISLSIVDEDGIGAGDGLDEAELANADADGEDDEVLDDDYEDDEDEAVSSAESSPGRSRSTRH